MKRKRFSVEQIVAVVKQAELGLPVADWEPPSHGPWKSNPAGISFADRPFRADKDANGRRKLTLNPDHQSQAPHLAQSHTSGRTTFQGADHHRLRDFRFGFLSIFATQKR